MTADADAHDTEATGDDLLAPEPDDIDAVMAEFTRRMESLRLDLDRITQNLDALGR
jgi:hypothetical protein